MSHSHVKRLGPEKSTSCWESSIGTQLGFIIIFLWEMRFGVYKAGLKCPTSWESSESPIYFPFRMQSPGLSGVVVKLCAILHFRYFQGLAQFAAAAL